MGPLDSETRGTSFGMPHLTQETEFEQAKAGEDFPLEALNTGPV